VINLLACSSLIMSILDPPVREVRLALWLRLVAQIRIRNRYNRIEELNFFSRGPDLTLSSSTRKLTALHGRP
jgi:hypothetical protein